MHAELVNVMPDSEEEQTAYLSTLLQLGRTLGSSLELSQVLDLAIDEVVEFVLAERGFIVLVDEETHRIWGKATRNIDPVALEMSLTGRDTANHAQISRTIVEQALTRRTAVVSLNAQEDPRFSASESIRLSQVRSVACVPLIAQGRALGVVYLDNRVKTGVFEHQHVEMLTAFANQAAVAIENARLYENLRRSLEERLQLQEELYAKETERRALEEANRLKSDFIGHVSHELRNPLTTIRGYVQTLREDGGITDEMRSEFYEVIEAEADRMLDLIAELLDSARLEAGRRLALNVRPMDLGALLSHVCRAQRYYKFWTDRHRLELHLDPHLPTINADQDKVHQILSNLLTNAIKYSPSGGTITVAAEPDGEYVRISVTDQGVGIAPEAQSRLFGRFERLDRREIERIPGTGLGLYLTRHLVDLHHGHITCESEPGEGSTFTVLLPIEQHEAAADNA